MHRASVIGVKLILHYDFIIRFERRSGKHYCCLQMLVNQGMAFTVTGGKRDNKEFQCRHLKNIDLLRENIFVNLVGRIAFFWETQKLTCFSHSPDLKMSLRWNTSFFFLVPKVLKLPRNVGEGEGEGGADQEEEEREEEGEGKQQQWQQKWKEKKGKERIYEGCGLPTSLLLLQHA